MRRKTLLAAAAASTLALSAWLATSATGQPAGEAPPPEGGSTAPMTFFVTSVGSDMGGNLGGLTGADEICARLAAAVGGGELEWRAYLSTQEMTTAGGTVVPAVNARDRIGAGPWHNAQGVLIAENLGRLHTNPDSLTPENPAANNINQMTALNERGEIVNGRDARPDPFYPDRNVHDMLTGTQVDGTAYALADGDRTCMNWTSASAGTAWLGHHDLIGNPTRNYWNDSHLSRGCSPQNLQQSGGAGLFYCFALDPITAEAVRAEDDTPLPPPDLQA